MQLNLSTDTDITNRIFHPWKKKKKPRDFQFIINKFPKDASSNRLLMLLYQKRPRGLTLLGGKASSYKLPS